MVRSRELDAGVPHALVEQRLEAAQTLHEMMALAMFGSASSGGEVVARVRTLGGQGCVQAFWDAKRGVHDPVQGDLRRLVEDTERLTKVLRQ